MRPLPAQLATLCLLLCLTLPACAPRTSGPATPDPGPPPLPPAQRDVLRIGVLRHAPPMSYANAAGTMTGFAVDLAYAVVQEVTGNAGKVTIVPLDPKECIPALLGNTVDVLLASQVITPERAKLVTFGEPYMVGRLGVLSPANRRISALVQLAGKRLAVPSQHHAEAYFRKLGVPLLPAPTPGEAFAALRNGRADAVGMDTLTLAAWAAANSGYVLSIPAIGEKDLIAPAVRKNDAALATAINSALAALEVKGFFLAAYNRHMPGYARLGLTPEQLFPVLGALP